MKIPGHGTTINELFKQSDVSKSKEKSGKAADQSSQKTTGETTSSDTITLSSQSGLVSKAVAVANNSPDIRAEKVSQVKKEIDGGQYTIDSKKVAEKILKESFAELV